ncbi:hypothetical protein C8E97_2770 [Saccharothrix australiensis]|uniref:Uncharacterized protein n=1 Tax=Saccharothrix australiensis TaxID=2072 RepID=A0A495VZI4_9PSEU|nr:hypothetical protein C8E97_2770 [Saccharothrix australiensis]
MPAEVTGDSPVLECLFTSGATAWFTLEAAGGGVLAGQLLCGPAELVQPHGPPDSRASVSHYVLACRHLLEAVTSAGRLGPESFSHWVRRRGLCGDDGRPLSLHRHRLRARFEVMRDHRSWFNSPRATIDANHTARVEGEHYLSDLAGGEAGEAVLVRVVWVFAAVTARWAWASMAKVMWRYQAS